MRLTALFIIACFISPVSFGADAYVDTKTQFTFPANIAEFTFSKVSRYSDDDLGYGVNYGHSDGTFATVVVYDLGLSNIGTGTEDPQVKRHMQQAQDDLQQAVKSGLYRSVQTTSSAADFSSAFLTASYIATTDDDNIHRTHLFVRGERKHFVKVSISGFNDPGIDAKAAKFIEQLLLVLGAKP